MHRIQKLKDMGMNGWGTAHNAPNPALLDAADRMGFLDENHRNGQQDDKLTTLVLRNRNHPSIVLWSIFNELLCETPSTDADFNRSVARCSMRWIPSEGALCQVTTTPSTDRTRHWTCKVREGEEDNVLVT